MPMLAVPQRFFTHGQNAQGDRHVYASRTRFIPDELLQHTIQDVDGNCHFGRYDPFRQRPGMEIGLRTERRRWMRAGPNARVINLSAMAMC
jgi:hypothetical protein